MKSGKPVRVWFLSCYKDLKGVLRKLLEAAEKQQKALMVLVPQALLLTLYLLEGGDYTLNISVKVGDGQSETTISHRSQVSITKMWPYS